MHLSSLEKMKRFIFDYLCFNQEFSILDVGSLSVNGSYREIFNKKNWKYTGVDIVKGENVDIVLKNPFNWSKELKSDSFDIVVSGQTFEHIERPWEVIKEIHRVMKPGGICCIIAPSVGDYHEPPDCWRFYSDGLKALAEYADLEVVSCITDKVGDWRDTTLIARKRDEEDINKSRQRVSKT